MTAASRSPEIPEVIGPYRVLGVLGRGGMGVVFRGQHPDTGEMVAIKTVTVDEEGLLASIRREIRALRQVRHPGVVRIVGDGVSAGLPWYAMELLHGITLRDHIQGQPPAAGTTLPLDNTLQLTHAHARDAADVSAPAPVTVPERLPTLALLRRLCAPLSFLHGAGLVHRDLKPENVFIQEDGRPLLVDLGVAGRFGGARGREELEATGMLMGTILYMAPEQIRGEPVDARADLYALGCILYECLTGRPPFQGTKPGILYQHLYEPPLPPSQQGAAIPAALDRLVLSLLEKRPQDRLGYADDVAAALGALGADGEPESAPRARAYVYRSQLIGRDHTLAMIAPVLDRLVQERSGGVILLRGESGVGKTRLALEISRRAIERGASVITGQCDALTAAGADGRAAVAGAPLHPLRQLLQTVADRCRNGGLSETERLLGPRLKVLRSYEPALAGVPGHDGAPEPEPLPPEAARARVIAALEATMFALAAPRPVVLLLDDLQWADALTLGALHALADGDIAAHGLLVVGTQRAEEPRAELDALGRASGVTVLTLDRLDADGVGAIVSGMLALRAPSRALIEALASHSEGNPFFVAEYLRAAIGEGLLTRDQAGAWQLVEQGLSVAAVSSALRIPGTLTELIERRLQGLGAPGQELVGWGAVLGREFDGELLLTGSGADDPSAADALQTLRLRHIVEDTDSGRLRFVHDKLREVAYGRLALAQRRALHGRAATLIESRYAGLPATLAILANHFSRADVPGRASVYFGRAGDHAFHSHANEDAIAHYRAAMAEAGRALAAAPEGREGPEGPAEPDEFELRRALPALGERLGDVLVLVGRHAEARDVFVDALERLPAAGEDARERAIDRARLQRKAAKTWEARHSFDQALDGYDAAEQALGAVPAQLDAGPGAEPTPPQDRVTASWWDEWLQIQGERIAVYYWLARLDRIQALVETIRPVVERHGTPLQRIAFYVSLLRMGLRSHRYRPDRDTVENARALLVAAEESGDASELAYAHFSLAVALVLHEAFAEAEPQLARALAAAERIGSQPNRCRCLTYLTLLHRRLGRVDSARGLAEQSLAATEAMQMLDYLAAARGNLAWLAWRDGQMDEAARHAEEALSLWATVYQYPLYWLALLPRMAVALAQGALERAIECARGMLHPEQQRLDDEVAVPLAEAIACAERGEPELARQAIASALQGAIALRYL
jgi:tetratricopeptide (TPR) repeat protein